jgi:hypothetical protein
MRQQTILNERKIARPKLSLWEKLLYLPGAIIIGYGLWLSLTLN